MLLRGWSSNAGGGSPLEPPGAITSMPRPQFDVASLPSSGRDEPTTIGSLRFSGLCWATTSASFPAAKTTTAPMPCANRTTSSTATGIWNDVPGPQLLLITSAPLATA